MTGKNKKIAIVFAMNSIYTFCAYVSIKSIINNSPLLYEKADIIVFTDSSNPDKKTLATIGNVKVIDYTFPLKIKETSTINRFSYLSFARYECFNLLNTYEKIIYLDSDILVQQELLNIFDLIENSGIGLTKEKVNVKVCANNELENINLEKDTFNSGFIVLTNKLRVNFKEITDFCYTKTAKLIEQIYLPDMAIINFAIKYFNLMPTELSMIYNTPASLSTKALKKAAVIHSLGHRKFWNYYYFDEWYKYYTQWIKDGGTPIEEIRKDSKIYRTLLKKLSLDKFVFFQLCPDIIKNPMKALRFFIKYVFSIKY